MNSLDSIRNFCIIAHIDHGKSTLADRLLEKTGTISKRKMKERVLDVNPISRERGITIKLAPVRMSYKLKAESYQLNLIDTPGHVDFSYEVSRSLAACQGAILLVDATSGIQAQTMTVYIQAKKQGLKMIPVVNKIDALNAEPEETAADIIKVFGFKDDEIVFASGKIGEGVDEILQAIVERIPPPSGRIEAPLRALVFDSHYNTHQGVIANICVVDGSLQENNQLILMASGAKFEASFLGIFTPQMQEKKMLSTGEVGFVATGLKSVHQVKVGDTITEGLRFKVQGLSIDPLPGYKEPKPVVFLGLYPVESEDYEDLKDALEKLHLNDTAFSYQPEFSAALGKGFRCGFSGLLHAEVTQERLEREFDLDLIASTPNVTYQYEINGKRHFIQTASQLPNQTDKIFEPWVALEIFTPEKYLGKIMELINSHRGVFQNREYLSGQARLTYEMPLSELIAGFFDNLKSVSSGYASLDYEPIGFRQVYAIRLDILIHHQKVDALSQIVVRDKAYEAGRRLTQRLKKVIPRQMFEVAIQAAIGGKIIARETIKAFRKDVTAKLYGGDQTRKDKLLKKQKKGKKRMKQLGRIQLPQEAFTAVLRRD